MTAAPPPTRRTQAERSAASEEALLRAAAELITERGLDGASLRSIGARAGTSRAMPSYHFGSKDELIAHLAQRGHELTIGATIEALERASRNAAELTKLDTLQVIIETFLDVVAAPATPEERAIVVMWGSTFASESRLPALDLSDRETHGALSQHISEGQDEGSIRPDLDASAAAVLIMGMTRGAAAISLAHPDLAEAAELRALCGRSIVAMLRAD